MRKLVILMASAALMATAACNTLRGAGQDVKPWATRPPRLPTAAKPSRKRRDQALAADAAGAFSCSERQPRHSFVARIDERATS
jgi:predicted small secreted protein